MKWKFSGSATGTLLLFCVVACSASPTQIVAQPQKTQLTGIVTDFFGLPILGAAVKVEGYDQNLSQSTDEDGVYNIDLPAGLYRLKVTAPGFCPMTRAPFVLESSTKIAMNFALYDEGLADILTIENGGHARGFVVCALPFKEETFPVNSVRSPLNLHVQFAEKSETGSVNHYKGISYSRTRQIGVVLSYNLMEIHADTVDLNKRTFKLEASGNVVVDTDTNQVRGKHVTIDLKSGPRIMNLCDSG